MRNPIFDNSQDFSTAKNVTMGAINNVSLEERWEIETPLFIDAILRALPPDVSTVLDYGCGVGRLSLELLRARPSLKVIGVDESPAQLNFARQFVNNPRFTAIHPHELNEKADAALLIYVLQHCPAIEIRDLLKRLHSFLKPGALMFYCSSDIRMTISEIFKFFDDRPLGVHLGREVERLFIEEKDLFTQQELRSNSVLRAMISAENQDGSPVSEGIPHPARIYRRKEVAAPYYTLPLKDVSVEELTRGTADKAPRVGA